MREMPHVCIGGSRSPCGERGLKCCHLALVRRQPLSLPVRGAWIEICERGLTSCKRRRRSPCGERGLKSLQKISKKNVICVAPRAGSVD